MLMDYTSRHRSGGQLDSIDGKSQIQWSMIARRVSQQQKKQTTNGIKFDDTGLAALVCRHDIPLFFANIDTPGEQQKYMVGLLAYLFTLLPPQTTVLCLYNVGCVLEQSLQLVSLLHISLKITNEFLTTFSV